jgi:hypothetical protein
LTVTAGAATDMPSNGLLRTFVGVIAGDDGAETSVLASSST